MPPVPPRVPEGIRLIQPNGEHWSLQRAWLEKIYPPELTWHLPFKLHALRPDIWGILYRFLSAVQVRQWAAMRGHTLLGVLAWQPHPGFADHLWLASSSQEEEKAVEFLVPLARQKIGVRRRMALDYPAGRAQQAFQEAGFHAQQTLIWMQLRLE
jgi:hypothetical protein